MVYTVALGIVAFGIIASILEAGFQVIDGVDFSVLWSSAYPSDIGSVLQTVIGFLVFLAIINICVKVVGMLK